MASHDFCYGCPKCVEEDRKYALHRHIEKLETTINTLTPFRMESGSVDVTISVLKKAIKKIRATV